MPHRYRLRNINVPLDSSSDELRRLAVRELRIDPESLLGLRIGRRSIDARKRHGKRQLQFVLHLDVTVDCDLTGSSAFRRGVIVELEEDESFRVERRRPAARIVVVGAGPAGLFAAYVLAEHGHQVQLIDRGKSLQQRGRDVVAFHRTRQPNAESNLLFGEGGAGTYSDGKLYTRVKDRLEAACLDLLIECGANEDIRYDSRAHIGTDRLHRILPVLRGMLAERGVEFLWGTRLDTLEWDPTERTIRAVGTTGGRLECDALFLAPGHSARDTVESLHRQGVAVEPKPFQLGVRIEHPQTLINRGRYGESDEARQLGAAYYNLTCTPGDGSPSSYSFCMCPGGRIVASVNEAGLLCTNGMSNSQHSSPWANAALVTTFGPQEFGRGAFDGVAFQRQLEALFFEAGGGDYTAPAQRADDFLHGRLSSSLPRTSYTFGRIPGRIDELLPARARDAIGRALLRFDRQIAGFAGSEGVLVGLESRSSGPLRLPRDRHSFVAAGTSNLYPIGEGAGYAGGIMSAAIDGARAAKRWLES